MPADDPEDLLRRAERRLQAAQLGSDVAELSALLDERVLFTGPDGHLYTKQDDLEIHRTGRQVIATVDEQDLRVVVAGRTGVTCFYGRVAGTLDGEPFQAHMRYTRTWAYDDDRGWQLIAGHASVVQ
jgi:hypothetical protein